METVAIFAVAACFLCAGVTYVVMDFRFHSERQDAMENVLSVQAQVGSSKKKLLGYTKYTEYLTQGKQIVAEKIKFLAAKVVREYVHIENIPKELTQQESNASVIVRYSVEFLFGFDAKPESFEILGTPNGIEIQIKKPTLITTPAVKKISFEIPCGVVPFDDKLAVADIQKKLPDLAQQYGSAMSSEEEVRAICEKKLIEFLRGFLAGQPGVIQLPGISVVYK